jgi:phosphoglycolate phosphatase-like HAD superfamily hydrolase
MKLVLFDLDGTLINAGPSGVPSLNKVMFELYGKKPVYYVRALAGRTDIHNFIYVYKAAFGRAPAPARLQEMKAAYLAALKRETAAAFKAKKAKPLNGAVKLLQTLCVRPEVKLALATGNFEEAAKIKLAPFGLAKYFNFAASGFGAEVKDRVSLLELAKKNAAKAFKTNFKAGDIFVIGDTHIDICAAKQLGFHSAAVTAATLGDAEKLRRAAAELECKDFGDAALWLMWLRLKADPKGMEKGSYIMPASAIEHVFFSRTGIDEQRLKMFRIKKYSDLESGKLL